MTSRPVLSWPSVWSRTRPRRPLRTRVCWVSARPSSQGTPAWRMLESGEAPVPPPSPLMRIRSAYPLATPVAMVPTPAAATSLTETSACGLAFLRSKIELRQVLDRIDVMVRRRRDQADARRAVTRLGDEVIDLVAGKLAPLARLGPLGHLDLDLDGAGQVVGGDSEAAAGNLLDRAVARVAVGVAPEPGRVLPPFSGVASAADPVHGDGQRLMGFLADAAEAHGAGTEPLDDLRGRLDDLQGNRFAAGLDLQQAAQACRAAGSRRCWRRQTPCSWKSLLS